jgi:hypothetical protein
VQHVVIRTTQATGQTPGDCGICGPTTIQLLTIDSLSLPSGQHRPLGGESQHPDPTTQLQLLLGQTSQLHGRTVAVELGNQVRNGWRWAHSCTFSEIAAGGRHLRKEKGLKKLKTRLL